MEGHLPEISGKTKDERSNDIGEPSSAESLGEILGEFQECATALTKVDKIQDLLNGLDLFNGDFSNMLESPFSEEDQKRVDEILRDNLGEALDENVPSRLPKKLGANELKRIKEIDELLAEMKANGHAYINNISSSKCRSKNSITMKTLEELKADMNRIDETLSSTKKIREAKEINRLNKQQNNMKK